MARKPLLLIIAGILIVVGISLIAFQPGPPDTVCVGENEPSSGFVDSEKDDCPISIESWAEISEHESGPQWFNIGGVVFIVAGVATGGVALLGGRRTRGPDAA